MANSSGSKIPSIPYPHKPVDVIREPFVRFMHIESASGVVLLAASVVALVLANSRFGEAFLHFWETPVGFSFGTFELQYSLHHWINDFLMAIFFFVIGLEVKRELVMGELQDIKRATLPIAAAIGGMLVPAAIYLLLQSEGPGMRGWGIPMATDIAFVVGCMALMGPRIPSGLRVMLLSLAIVDDIGAILVIAIGYTAELDLLSLLIGTLFILVFIGCMKIGLRHVAIYGALAFLIWYFIHESGIHATIAGVIIGLLTPTKPWVSKSRLRRIIQGSMDFLKGEGWNASHDRHEALRSIEQAARKTLSPLELFERELHPITSFIIMPLFALANAGVVVETSGMTGGVGLAVLMGLLIGKPIGVFLSSWLTVKLGLAKLPRGVNWKALIGGGMLAGIGFTMALFIAGLALGDTLLSVAKIGILTASALSAILGMLVLHLVLPRTSGN